MNNFDLICTATLRPELLKRTFDSHIDNLFGDHIKKANLIMNIDKVGNKDIPGEKRRLVDEIFDYIDTIPFASVSIKICNNPSFSRAFYYLIGQLKSELTFNLEEDWELKRKFDFKRMVNLFKARPRLMHLRLSYFHSYKEGTVDKLKQWNKTISYNGEFFEVPRNLRGVIGWAGHPSLNRSDFFKIMRMGLKPDSNHEKQIKGHRPILIDNEFGVFHPREAEASIIDIGRGWCEKNGFRKKGIKAFFTEWERVK